MIFSILMFSLIICVWGGVEQPLEIEAKYTQDKFVSLRAVLAMLIVFGHTWPNYTYGNEIIDHFLAPFNNTGYLDTGIFFFLSGLGTYESAKKRGNYFDYFFKNKVLKIFVPYWFINLIYILMEWIVNSRVDIGKVLLSFVWPVYNKSAWYVFAVLIVYVILYVLIHKMDLQGNLLYIALAGCLFLYIVVFFLLRIGSWWYVSTFAVFIGVIFSDFKERFVKRFPTSIFVCIFLALYFGLVWNIDGLPYPIIIGLKMLTATLLPLVVCGIMKRKRIESRILSFIGKCSYEIYLVQGLFVLYLKIRLQNTIISSELTSLGSVACSVMVGCILHLVIECVRSRCHELKCSWKR